MGRQCPKDFVDFIISPTSMSDLRTKLMQGASAGSSGGSMKKADSVVAIVRDSLLLSAAPPRSLKVSFRDSMLPLYQFCPLQIRDANRCIL